MAIFDQIIRTSSDCLSAPLILEPNRKITRQEFIDTVSHRASIIRQTGLGPDDSIILPTGRGADFWIDLSAVWAAGAKAVPLNHRLPAEEQEVIISAVKPKAVVGSKATAEAFSSSWLNFDSVQINPEAPHSDYEPKLEEASEATNTILFTSGSTGTPKEIKLSARSLLMNAKGTISVIPVAPDDKLFMPVPFNFISAISHFLAIALSKAAIIATEEQLLFEQLGNRIRETGATCFGGSPIHLRWIAAGDESATRSLRWLMSSGDHFPFDLKNLLLQKFPHVRVFNTYGMTELAGRFCIGELSDISDHDHCVGKPIPGLHGLAINGEGKILEPGEFGEIVAAAEWIDESQVNLPDDVVKRIGSPAISTGDLGYIHPDNNISLVGRANDVFKCGGAKVDSFSIQRCLMETGMFAEVAVVPVEHLVLGAVPHAYVVPKPGMPVNSAATLKHVRANLPSRFIPHKIIEMDALPKTPSGKIDKRGLKTS